MWRRPVSVPVDYWLVNYVSSRSPDLTFDFSSGLLNSRKSLGSLLVRRSNVVVASLTLVDHRCFCNGWLLLNSGLVVQTLSACSKPDLAHSAGKHLRKFLGYLLARCSMVAVVDNKIAARLTMPQ